jgi:hypothetical protein
MARDADTLDKENAMKHVTSMSKARPKQAFSLPSFDISILLNLPGMLGSMADSIFKTPEEKDEKKGTTPA